MNIEEIIAKTAEETATRTVKKLTELGKINRQFSNSFKKTEELLYLYPKLPPDNPERIRVDKALEKIADDEYCDVIASRYFDGMTIAEISEIYDCKYQNISKKRNKLMKILASELFPEDVLKELLSRWMMKKKIVWTVRTSYIQKNRNSWSVAVRTVKTMTSGKSYDRRRIRNDDTIHDQ